MIQFIVEHRDIYNQVREDSWPVDPADLTHDDACTRRLYVNCQINPTLRVLVEKAL